MEPSQEYCDDDELARPRLAAMAVVIPARNEQPLLSATLAALAASMAHFHRQSGPVPVLAAIVLDCTTDDSRQVLTDFPAMHVLTTAAGRVGSARNEGIRHAVGALACPPERIWILNTDADTIVPTDWLHQHWRLAVEGWDVVAGTVEPHGGGLTARQLSLWHLAHKLAEGHGHVHGANLGFRGDVYGSLGGYRDAAVHEDRDFVQAARNRGYLVRSTDLSRVRTSGRQIGRVRGGFADYLSRLSPQDAQLPVI
ncbi:glycosyltransferase [Specibacter sp. RAF43]|uniref:glycosyltransferase n=1 Tax=Specibacter sp. RAF43 TaxID=3233057 RepID=UPI003F953D06